MSGRRGSGRGAVRAVDARLGAGTMIGASPLMRAVWDQVDRPAGSDVAVLITGETGTGKDMLARMLHDRSERRNRPFVPVNCCAIPESLLEAELFGHAAGAFTGASGARPGVFRAASGGTLFLDEIGEMPKSLQAKLLRAVQERAVRPVGETREVPFDARIVSATQRDPHGSDAVRWLRPDLFYRLSGVWIILPPLRERGEDILLLARTFIERQAASLGLPTPRFSEEAAEALRVYGWPGNVREMENCMHTAALAVLGRDEEVRLHHLPPMLTAGLTSARAPRADRWPTLREIEIEHIQAAIERAAGNRSVAARLLGIARSTLVRKLGRNPGPSSGKRP